MGLQMPVRPGDSGGPVFDAEAGELLGIVSARADPTLSGGSLCQPMVDGLICHSDKDQPPMNATALATNLTNLLPD